MHETTTPIVDSEAITNVFLVYVNRGIAWKTSVKFDQRNGFGHRFAPRTCWSVISAVSTMKTTGSRKIMATAIITAWLPTDRRKRRRRSCGGIGRGTTETALRGRAGGARVVAIGSLPGSAPIASRS